MQLRLDDTLNLFETIGLLLGKTGLDAAEQQRHLTQVITPHVRSIEQILEQKQAVAQEPEVYGEILSGSIAAIAFLSKGFKPPLPYGVQIVLLETLKIASVVLETLPNNEQVRNKSFVLLQQLIEENLSYLLQRTLGSMDQRNTKKRQHGYYSANQPDVHS